VIFLQEVENWIIEILLGQAWAKSYHVTDPDGRTLNRYGVMILSKAPMKEVILQDFKSSVLGRKMLMARVAVTSGPPLVVGTFHLESFPNQKSQRNAQVKTLCGLASHFSSRIICGGDTNFAADSEKDALDDRFSDVWEALRPKELGATFSTEENPMTKEACDFTAHARIDRLWYTHGSVKVSSIERIGTKSLDDNGKWFPSDHFGLVMKCSLASKPVSAEGK